MKYFVVSDIHGCYTKLIDALQNVNFNENDNEHILVICGDLFDRGNESAKVYEYIKRLYDINKAIVVKGNHELFFDGLINNNLSSVRFNIEHNGFGQTLIDLTNLPNSKMINMALQEIKDVIEKRFKDFFIWIENLPFYYETEHYVFTHAGIDLTVKDWKKGNWNKAVWNDLRDFQKIDLKSFNFHKKLVMGHYPTSILNGNSNCQIYFHPDHQKIFIDGGAAYQEKNSINVLVVED